MNVNRETRVSSRTRKKEKKKKKKKKKKRKEKKCIKVPEGREVIRDER